MSNPQNSTSRTRFSKTNSTPVQYPDLLALQFHSFNQFFQKGENPDNSETLHAIFKANFPITDSKKYFTLEYLGYTLEKPLYTPEECVKHGITYESVLKVRLKITTHEGEEEKVESEELFFGNIPYMTPQGSFMINGIERVIVPQIHRSYGVFFTENNHISGEKLYSGKIIPQKGTWLEFSTDLNKAMYAYINYRKKFLITVLLRILGYSTDRDILELFDLSQEIKVTPKELEKHKGRKLAARILKKWTEEFVDEETSEIISVERSEILLERDTKLDDESIPILLASGAKTATLHKDGKKDPHYIYLYNTLQKDDTNSEKEAIDQVYRQLRNSEPPDEQTARGFVHETLFSPQRSYLGKVGRYCINKKLGLKIPADTYVLTKEDLLQTIKHLFLFINGKVSPNDIDHLSNRRVKVVGEQLHFILSTAISRMARTIQDRMNVRTADEIGLRELVSIKTITTMVNTFFQTNPLSQFMDQTNPLSEITHKRRLSALGTGGLSRERAGFEARDVHHSHYGRICVIQTPEGLNIGLISSLSVLAQVNDMGFIETPYRKVSNGVISLKTKPTYFSAEEEKGHYIAHGTTDFTENGKILDKRVKARQEEEFLIVDSKQVTLIDVSRDQIVSAAASLIPFLSHNEASRGLMASNMQRQAVPLLNPEEPIVGTGVERRIIKDARTLLVAKHDGVVEYVDATKVIIKNKLTEQEKLGFIPETHTYYLKKLVRTNHNTCVNQEPTVTKGQKVKKGDFLCDGFAIKDGELALGKNLKVAFMPYQGYNFEDAIAISERVVKEDIFTSIHLAEYELDLCDTKFGPEEFTSEIPNVSEKATQHLDENGLATVGTSVKEGNILIGRITPKGQTDQSPESQILQSIFGEDVYNKKRYLITCTSWSRRSGSANQNSRTHKKRQIH